MTRSQWQHYLPQVYLKGFAIPTGEVWRYDRVDGALKLLGTPVIGAERDLYTTFTGADLSQEIETSWFSPLDGKFGPIRAKIENREVPSAEESVHLANFAAYLHIRTPAMIRETETRFGQIDTLLGPNRDAIKYHTEPPDHGADTFVVAEERYDNVSPRRADKTSRTEVLKLLVGAGTELARALLNLEWVILVTSQRRSFIVGDRPFVIVPPESHNIELEGVGPLTSGAAVFVPLNSRLCLRVRNFGPPGISYRQVDGAAVRAINACLTLNSEQYLFSQSDALLKRLVTRFASKPGKNHAELVFRKAPSASDQSRSLVHWFTKSSIGNEWARRVPMD